ncbi:QacE family quaternary ammonium compound efflux SMR transporter [Nocardioides sp. WL0053]|jgi:small multidrug resistance pump|uniref:QacE family quaternary ammonium compound efflux SMR transporter n=1 Tax=Nocardioides jiangsuensis TaxID=2866161 RepID=A0ABS7RJY4_9ACTN|nr:SMR family transporter [Nocardioides jiangsuensis]MBY9075359.1 QacE family quaternary ammonium compound efflux SMR transporter [Nocardioides jiangsuensis]
MVYLLLALAIAAELFATMCLRASDGFTRLSPSAGAVLGYAAAFWLLSLVLVRGVPVGVAYAIWAAVGVAAVAALGWWLFDERLTLVQGGGLLLIVVGVVALELGGAH